MLYRDVTETAIQPTWILPRASQSPETNVSFWSSVHFLGNTLLDTLPPLAQWKYLWKRSHEAPACSQNIWLEHTDAASPLNERKLMQPLRMVLFCLTHKASICVCYTTLPRKVHMKITPYATKKHSLLV